jgi:DNA-binding CsgD family transcriptional regulator
MRPGPLRIRIEADDDEVAAELRARARQEGLALAEPEGEAELVARPSRFEPTQGRASALSPRELEILEYLVDGWSSAQIASALRIGVRTVRFHLEGIYGKLGVSRRGEAAREALRLGLVRLDF